MLGGLGWTRLFCCRGVSRRVRAMSASRPQSSARVLTGNAQRSSWLRSTLRRWDLGGPNGLKPLREGSQQFLPRYRLPEHPESVERQLRISSHEIHAVVDGSCVCARGDGGSCNRPECSRAAGERRTAQRAHSRDARQQEPPPRRRQPRWPQDPAAPPDAPAEPDARKALEGHRP